MSGSQGEQIAYLMGSAAGSLPVVGVLMFIGYLVGKSLGKDRTPEVVVQWPIFVGLIFGIVFAGWVVLGAGSSTPERAASSPQGKFARIAAAAVAGNADELALLTGDRIVYITKLQPDTPSQPVGRISPTAVARELAGCAIGPTSDADEDFGGSAQFTCQAKIDGCPPDRFVLAGMSPNDDPLFLEYQDSDAARCAPPVRFEG